MAEEKNKPKSSDSGKARGQQDQKSRNQIGDSQGRIDKIQKAAELTPKPVPPKGDNKGK